MWHGHDRRHHVEHPVRERVPDHPEKCPDRALVVARIKPEADADLDQAGGADHHAVPPRQELLDTVLERKFDETAGQPERVSEGTEKPRCWA